MIYSTRTALLTALLAFCFPACHDGGKQSEDIAVPNLAPPLPVCYSTPAPPDPGMLSWDAPLWPFDCSAMDAVAGYRVYYGTAAGTFTGSVDVGNRTSVPLSILSSAVTGSGSYYLVVTAYDSAGQESGYSNEVMKDL